MESDHILKVVGDNKLVDALMVVDADCNIVAHKLFTDSVPGFDEKRSLGKKPWEVIPNLSPETSTVSRAINYGEYTKNNLQKINYENRFEYYVIDNTFPIISKNKTIGALSATRLIEMEEAEKLINLFTMTERKRKNLYHLDDIIGNSPLIKKLKKSIAKTAKTDSTILISGETGSGKELVAQSIHTSGERADQIMISQNCAAIPGDLLEGLFFGTTKGSFTGAMDKPGLFELADKGTLFLDEINSMDLQLQSKLLRVIEEKTVTRIGGDYAQKFDVRILAAINCSPEEALKQGLVRKDLYYRLENTHIPVPSLRERTEDIPLFVQHFIDEYNEKFGKQVEGVTDEFMKLLKKHDWPGNVRELKNLIEGIFNFTDNSIIDTSDLPARFLNKLQDAGSSNLKQRIDNTERDIIIETAGYCKTKSELANKLGISRQLLNAKMDRLRISDLIGEKLAKM